MSPQPFQLSGAAPSLLPESWPTNGSQLRCRRVRLYLVGSDADTQAVIDPLHIGGRIDRIEWTQQPRVIPANGVLIRRDPGDVLRYLQRERLFS